MSAIEIFHQLSRVGRTTAATSRSLAALPHSFCAAAGTDKQLVYRRSTVLARVFASPPLGVFSIRSPQSGHALVVSHGGGRLNERYRDLSPVSD